MITDRVCNRCGTALPRVLGKTGIKVQCKNCGHRNYIGINEIYPSRLTLKSIKFVVESNNPTINDPENNITFETTIDLTDESLISDFIYSMMKSDFDPTLELADFFECKLREPVCESPWEM